MVNIVKGLSFSQTLLFILLDIAFIVLVLLIFLSIKKYNLDNKWYSFLIIAGIIKFLNIINYFYIHTYFFIPILYKNTL